MEAFTVRLKQKDNQGNITNKLRKDMIGRAVAMSDHVIPNQKVAAGVTIVTYVYVTWYKDDNLEPLIQPAVVAHDPNELQTVSIPNEWLTSDEEEREDESDNRISRASTSGQPEQEALT